MPKDGCKKSVFVSHTVHPGISLTDWEDEASVIRTFAIQKLELFLPQALDDRGIDEAMRAWLC